jgi:hypothetical protein
MYKFCFLGSLFFLISSCNTRDSVDKELLDSIYEIHIKNSVSESFGGIEEYRIKDKREVALICKELLALNEENNLQTRPFEGSIIIEFYKNNTDGSYEASNLLSTVIILKPNGQYYIDTFRGQYTSDPFLAKIIKYLKIEENKVTALDNYRKIKK